MKKQLLTKMLLVAVLLGVGASNVWATPESVFTQNFTKIGESTNVSDYGFTTITENNGSPVIQFAETDGKLVIISGGNSNSDISAAAKADFTAISGNYNVSFSCTWGTGSATGTRGYSRLVLRDASDNDALIIQYNGQDKNLQVNGTTVATGVEREQTFAVTATLNISTQEITALQIGSVYTQTGNISFQSASATTVSRLYFVANAKAGWTNTSFIDNIVITKEAVYSYTVNAVIKNTSTILKTMTGVVLAGESVQVPYPKYINYNGTLYTKEAISKQYRYDFTPAADKETKQLEYTATDISNVIFYAEGEDIDGVTLQNNGGCYSRSSNCATGVASNTPFVTLPAGSYKITVGFYNANSGTHTVTVTDGTNPIFSNAFAQNWNTYTSPADIIFDGTKTLYATGGDDRASYPKGIDYIYITGSYAVNADVTCLIENPDMETAGSGSGYQEEVKGWNNCSVVTNYRRLANSGVSNPNGAFTNTYSFENWTGAVGGLVGQMSQTISGIPNGVYKLQLAALVDNVNGQFIYGKSNGKTYKTSIAGDANVANDYSVIVVVEDNQLEIGLDMNGSGATWVAIDNARLTYMPADATVPATVGANGYTTFASTYPLDLTDANRPAGLKAYKATLTGSTLSFTKLNQTVPAGTGLLLLGETKGSTYNIPVAASGDAIPTAFTGVTTATPLQSVENTTYYFVMKKAASAGDALAFAPLSTASAVTIPAGKAYITVPNSAFGGTSRSLSFSFDDDSETTGINAVNGEGLTVNGSFFDLQGRRVAQPTKGLYIVNGKKVVIK